MAEDDAPEDLIRYDILVEDALRGVIRKVLGEIAKTGLPGNHHFYITFLTRARGVRMSSRLLAKHPHEITIVLQHQFDDLNVTDAGFEVGLSFGGVPERLLVPFNAITAFADPSTSFALHFQVEGSGQPEAEIEEAAAESEKASATVEALVGKAAEDEKAGSGDKAKPEDGTASVVSLDAFRKKN
jgi:hypothetical protein